ncbi:MAG: cyclic peptide export ABC transporter [Magnetococcus sp. DMHC-1]|nr:cyclic peptide export ABC transporter [Magnetococcales bacterium]
MKFFNFKIKQVKFTHPAKNILGWINKEIDRPKSKLIFMAVSAGLANALLLAIVNHAAEMLSNNNIHMHYLVIYMILLGVFIYAQYFVFSEAFKMVEEGLFNIRVRITEKIRLTNLDFIESIGYNYVCNSLTQDSSIVSQNAPIVFKSILSAILVFFTMLYVAYLSIFGFIIGISAISLAFFVFLKRRDLIVKEIDYSIEREIMFFNIFEQTFKGFKEIKINSAKSRDLFKHQEMLAKEVEHYKGLAAIDEIFVLSFSEIFFYSLFAIIIFIWPLFVDVSPILVVKLITSFLFLTIGPLDWVLNLLPKLLKMEISIINLRNLEETIDAAIADNIEDNVPDQETIDFHSLSVKNVRFEYIDSSGKPTFAIGPINFEILYNEIVFIIGSNGSGKSTLLKVLVGLYYFCEGTILLNGIPVNKKNYANYREYFSAVFSDFHIFERIYGVKDLNEDQVRNQLVKMGLENNTKFLDGQFTNINLSTGQRKRLAYIAAMLEDKPIYILDEWAADQDPNFRKYFYDVLLPDLRNRGKTVIAVSHDDRYFYAADRLLKFDNGVITGEIINRR